MESNVFNTEKVFTRSKISRKIEGEGIPFRIPDKARATNRRGNLVDLCPLSRAVVGCSSVRRLRDVGENWTDNY